MRSRRIGVLALAVVLLVACGARQSGPSAALGRYGDALNRGDYEAAYGLMSEAFRAKHTRQEYVRMLKENQREVTATASRLKGRHSGMEVSAEFFFGVGDTMRLVQEQGAWRIASNPMVFYSQATPRDALRSAMRAYHLKRWDVMLRFVPDKWAKAMDEKKMELQFTGPQKEQISTMMNIIQANLDLPIDERGKEARMPYGGSFEVSFVREGGQWKIKDFD